MQISYVSKNIEITQILLCCVLTMLLIINKISQLLISLSYLSLPAVVELQNNLFHMCVARMHVKDAGKHTRHLRLPVVVMAGIRFQLHTCHFPFTHTPHE